MWITLAKGSWMRTPRRYCSVGQRIRLLVSLRSRRVEWLIRVKSIEAQSSHVAVVRNFGVVLDQGCINYEILRQ
ncbi:hypothetical protein TNCV_3253581 [Trichonephila clavipes]|nr:hypothetical protein TNCV_3253581 [Trichonephila clavipes]